MRAIHFNFLIIIVFNCTYSFGQFNPQQQKRLDSLGKILNNPESHDTSKAETCVKLSEMLYTSNNDTLKPLCKKAKAISEKGLINPENEAVEGKFLYILSHAYNNLGYINSREGNTDSAFYYYEKSIEVQEKIHDTLGVANTYNNMAFIYYQQGKIPKALELFHESLKLKEQLKELKTLSHAYSNIGAIHRDLQNDSLALYYYKKGLKLRKQVGDKRGVSNSYNNIAVMMKDIQHGIDFHKKALQIRIEINNEPGIASSYNNIGNAYIKLGNLEKAEEHVSKSLPISYRIGSKKGIASSKNLLAKIYFLQKKFKKAKQYGEESLALAQETEDVIKIKDASQILSNIYEKMGSGIKALEMYKLQSLMQDSLDGKAAQKASAQEQAKYEYETQKAIDDAEHSKQIIIEQEEKQRQKIISIAVGIGLVLVVLFLVFVFNRLQITKKQKIVIESQKQEVEEQKRLVEHQKDEVEEAHKEITDSINYAERIQRSFLATDDILNENLNEHFVFFQPKEAVSGDFYWAGKLPNNQFAMVNADSTGHGVPGAIMSILNISSIEKAIEKGLKTPSDIFNDTRKTIIDRLKKDGSEEGGKDGMDASIIVFDFENNKFSYTAAQNPIWVIRNGEVIKIKPEKMPVGKHDHDSIPFVGGKFETQKGDQVYTLTDGYQDQFGGPKGKKFMIKKMREYVLSVSHLPMKEQHQKIKDTFNTWMGDLEQIDDVCVIGVKV